MDELDEENRFVYTVNEELPSLQEMASFQIALAVWNGYSTRCSTNKWKVGRYEHPSFLQLLGLYSTYREDTDKLVETLKAPRSIETILKTSLKKIRKEMKECIRLFSHEALFFKYYKVCRGITTFKPHWCVWRPNGKLDYLKTGEMMVSPENNELDFKEKFCIMCDFFMEEKMKSFPLDSLPADFIENCFEIDSARYWIKYLKGEWKESYDYRMIADITFNDTAGFQMNHFWHRLSDDDQVKLAYRSLVGRFSIYREKWQAVEPQFGSMSWDQQNRFLSMPQAAKQIIIFSCSYSLSSKCAVWAWKHCRGMITKKDFCSILCENFSYPSDRKKDVIPTVLELWDLAYDHQKNFSVTELETLLRLIFLENSDIAIPYYSSATYTLLNKCLAPKSLNERKAVIMKFAIKLATGTQDPSYIQEVLNFNLPHSNDQIEFKKFLMNSDEMKRHCVKLWVNGNFDILNANVEFYCDADMSSIQQYYQKLLFEVTSENWAVFADKSVITNVDKWQECCKLIDKNFPHDPAKALIAKQQLVSRFLRYKSSSKRLCKHLDLAIKTVDSIFPIEAELKRVKTEFIKAHPAPDGEFWKRKDLCDDMYFHSMIEWCCEKNEEGMVELKNKIKNHDTIFDIVFFQLNKVYVTEPEATGLKISLLTRLDKYLSWYLTDENEIRDYKMSKLNKSDKLKIFTTISEPKDDLSLKMLLEWFFDGDEAKVRDFRSKKMKFC